MAAEAPEAYSQAWEKSIFQAKHVISPGLFSISKQTNR